MKEWTNYSLITVTPFDYPDEHLAYSLHRAGSFSVLDIGHCPEEGKNALKKLSKKIKGDFGIRLPAGIHLENEDIPKNVKVIILSDDKRISDYPDRKIIIQVTDIGSAVSAEASGAWSVIAKGSESGGEVKSISSFILFQRLKKIMTIPVFVQGGCGIHTAPAVLAAGGAGVVFDSQLSLLRESRVPKPLKAIIEKLDGTETKVCAGHRILSRPDSPGTTEVHKSSDVTAKYGGLDVKQHFIPMGQDIAFAKTIYDKFKNTDAFVFAIKESIYAHIRQAKDLNTLGAESQFALEHKIQYPIAQGPMSSISDNPSFAEAIAKEGGLPFIALSTLRGKSAFDLLEKTAVVLDKKSWGVGLLGFLPKDIFEEQLDYIFKVKPQYALIAGGRPAQVKKLEKAGITSFLHVPTPGLLDLFLKDGARNFVFEGRECGGHIGPLSCFVLWEQQIERLMAFDKPEELNVFFAGGIHDAFSAAMISVMTAPLVAKGVKVGVLMGTSYLYTDEAVKTGALLQHYQDKAVEKSETYVLSTAPGHETRCLNSHYVEHFESVKKDLLQKNSKGEEIWQTLEQMNMGRLQIAARGKKWVEGSIIDVDENYQADEGLYMIGQVASLKDSTTTVAALHHEISEGSTRIISELSFPSYPQKSIPQVDIAVIGISCILPGSQDHAVFWKNILSSKNLITEVPDVRWNKEIYYDPEAKNPESGLGGKKTNTKWGGFIPDINFDPLDYGIPPQSLAAIDPVQLLSLKVSTEALDDAGYNDRDFDRENTAVIFGTEAGTDLAGAYGLRNIFPQYFGEIPKELDAVLPTLTEDSFPGVLGNVISGRIANRLDLGGRNYTVDAACASSMAAIDSACKELASGSANMVIAGGADSHNSINDYLMFSSLYTLASGDRSRPFDADTDGLCMGEGIAAVVLKRYDDAVNDGDRVYGVIKGIGGSSDGKSLGLTAPRKEGQVRALTRAYAQAGISAADVGLIEAHGTGTIVGDKTEMASLTETFMNAGAAQGTCTLGTVKSQIGHTKCAAGMAGLIKTVLSVYHGILPPTINIQQANSYYNNNTSPFVFSSMARPWLADKRVAGISAFGFGGTNFHIVLENCKEQEHTPFTSLDEWPAELILIHGRDLKEAEKNVKTISTLLSIRPDIRLRDIAYSLILKKEPVYAVIIAENCDDLKTRLAAFDSGTNHPDIHYVKPVAGKVAFMFSGQGSQRPGMLADLFVSFPFLKKYLNPLEDLNRILYPADAYSKKDENYNNDAVKDTINAQPLLGVTGMAIAGLFKELGIEPDMLGGHSYGEIPALCCSGAIDIKDLVTISKKRAESILRAVENDRGKMAAVLTDKASLEAALTGISDVVTANHNSPGQSVIAGPSKAVDAAIEQLKRAGLTVKELPVACAFHSPVIQKAEANFMKFLDGIVLNEPSIPVWSNTTAAPYPVLPEEMKIRLSEHLVKPVSFVNQIKAMEKDGAAVFIEMGPGNVLTGLIKATVEPYHPAFCTDKKGENGIKRLMTSLAQYIATGRSFNFEKLFEDRSVTALDLEKPEQYRLKPTVWSVNGHMSVPLQGTLPDNAMKPVETPLRLTGGIHSGELSSGDSHDQTVNTYLNNVKEIMAAQRDVMLGYLGYTGETSFKSIPGQTSVRESNNSGTPVQTVKKNSQPQKPLKDLLLDIVADRTGYPTEMLEMTLDLEADLSIDSIKRIEIIGELSSQLGLETGDDDSMQDAMEELAAIKTLEGILIWLEEKGIGQKESQTVSGSTEYSREQIQASLIDIVAVKTGYPTEMLDMTLDLEADLSIDSIKRIEILGELNTQLSLVSGDEDQSEQLMEELAAIKTLEGIIDWLCDKAVGNNNVREHEGDNDPENRDDNADKNKGPLLLNRYKAVFSNAPVITRNSDVMTEQTFAITNDTLGVAGRLSEILIEKGARVHIIKTANGTALPENTDGLIHLSPLSGKEDHCSAIDLFDLVKQVNPEKVKWVYGVSALGGDFGETSDVDESLKNYQGLAGFIKSLSKEWHNTRCRYIDVNRNDNPDNLVSQILDELFVDDTICEIGYSKGLRRIYDIQPNILDVSKNESVTLNSDSVILALGGAKGITAEIVIKLSKQYGCKFILVGRSGLPEKDEEALFSEITETTELRKAVIGQGHYKKPSDIEAKVKKILSERQLRTTLNAIEVNGGRYEYISLDVTDGNAFAELIKTLYDTHGRIDGVLHGAGVIDDKFFNQKSKSSFNKVFTTKVIPATVISKHIRDDVQFISFFSSIASAFGNKGQIDYSSANDTLDKLAININSRVKGRAFSINWGPWAGQGMVSEELSREYAKAGIGLIPPDEGADALMDEIRYGKKENTRLIIMCGSPDSMLLQGEIVNG